jgi:FtsP/CotA-like multicopper oxidase with cupredoxin domain
MEEPTPQGTLPPPPPDPASSGTGGLDASLTRRGFLRGAALAGTGLVAATVAACAPAGAPVWEYATSKPQPVPTTPPATPQPSEMPGMTMPPATPAPTEPVGEIPAGWTEHDVKARDVVRRYLGNLAPALATIYPEEVFNQLADILGAADNYPELSLPPSFAQVSQVLLNDLVNPLAPTLDGDVKVFELTVDEMEWRIDEKMAPVQALGYNAQWPGPTIRVTEGDTVRVIFKNNLRETTGIHFHGVDFDNFFMDGVPFVTQKPIPPGETFTYEFVAKPAGSMMYHSHHNATDQVGRGLLGAFVIDPRDDPDPVKAYEKRYGYAYDREYIWISNDTLGGFTINGHGFPAVIPVVAAVGETVLVRYMNEGIMMHPWHSHGYTQKIVARDGRPLGAGSFDCDTFAVNPGERIDAIIECDRAGVWAYHCHILPHVEGLDGMFGMVTTLLVVPTKEDVDTVLKAVADQYTPA